MGLVMTDSEILYLLEDIALRCNNMIDTLIIERQASVNGRKQKLSYITKKLEVIVGAANKSLDKLNYIDFKLDKDND
jgi:hypothetical protein